MLDMGSTSFHLLVADVCPCGKLERVVRRRVYLQLGRWLVRERGIPQRVCEEAVAAARSLADLAAEHEAEHLFPIGTAALRDATNGMELARQLEADLELDVTILSGLEEAHTFLGALRERHGGAIDPCVGLDLGGGSLEIARGTAAGITSAMSLPLGAVRMHSAFEVDDPMSRSVERSVREHVRAELERMDAASTVAKARTIFGSGGSLRALSRLADAAVEGPKDHRLWAELLDGLCGALVASTQRARRRMAGMNPHRARTLPTAAVIVSELICRLEIPELIVSDWGLREGVLLQAVRAAG